MSWLRLLFPLFAIGDGAVRSKVGRVRLSTISQINDEGLFRLDGVASASGSTSHRALLSGLPCLASRTVIDVATHGRTGGWLHLVDKLDGGAFWLTDDRGVLVRESVLSVGDRATVCCHFRRESVTEASRAQSNNRETPFELVGRGSRRRPLFILTGPKASGG